ncbi:MAG TPA: glycosyltransferase family 9 protein [Phycisphaerae bacterium]
MRWIDHWVGLPLCFLFGLLVRTWRQLRPHAARSVSGRRPIAVFKFFGLGSIVEATPLLRAIRARYPGARLVFVTFESNAGLLRRLNLCTDVRLIRTDAPLHFVTDVLRQVAWLIRQRTEAVIDLEFFSKFSTLLSFLSAAPIRVAFHLNDFWRYSLVTHPVYFNYYRHITEVYEQVGRQLDIPIEDSRVSTIAVDECTVRTVAQGLQRRGWSAGQRLLGININAGDLALERRWPRANFEMLIRALLARHADIFIVLTGSPADREYVGALLERLPPAAGARVISCAGTWTLDEFIAALSLFDGFITNDSGPMHLAAAQGVPLVSLWGPARPEFYAPRVVNHRVLYERYPCSPCVNMFTTFAGMWCHHEGWCMQAITPEAVLEAAKEMLAAADVRPPRHTRGAGVPSAVGV